MCGSTLQGCPILDGARDFVAKLYQVRNNFHGGWNSLSDPRDIDVTELSVAKNISVDKKGRIRTSGALVAHGDMAATQAADVAPGWGLLVYDTDHTEGTTDTGDNWTALADASNAQIDLFNLSLALWNQISGASPIDLGTVTTHAESAGKIDFPTTSTITCSDNDFTSSNIIRPGDIVKITNATDSGNNTTVIITKVAVGTLTVRGTPLTVQASEANAITLTVLIKANFYFADEILRVSDGAFSVATQPFMLAYINQTHWADATGNGSNFTHNAWTSDAMLFDNVATGVQPNDIRVINTFPTNRNNVRIEVSTNANAGSWVTGTYQVALSLISYGNEESKLRLAVNNPTFTASDGDKLTLTLRVNNNSEWFEGITGARIYFRLSGGNTPWILLADMDTKDGGRATLFGEYAAWSDSAGANDIATASFDSFAMNIDTYESLTGYPALDYLDTSRSISFNTAGDGFVTGLITHRRAFVANLTYTGRTWNASVRMRDRIVYSPPGVFDTFPVTNFIDVVKGDAEEYVKLESWGDQLLAFKQRRLHVINIADGSPSGWFVEQGSPHDFRGVAHPGAVFRTPHGIVWCNEWGVWLYNGQVIDLLENRIDPTAWTAFWTDYTITGYHPSTNQLIFVRDATGQGGSSQNETMFYDFDTHAWTEGKGIFDTSKRYTNFQNDWNQDLIIGEEAAGTVTIKKWDPTPTAVTVANGFEAVFNDEDFDNPAILKEMTGIGLTYKSSAAQSAPISYYLNGATSSPTTLTGSFSAVSVWTKLIIEPSPISCNSFRVRVINNENTGTIEIGDVVLRRRDIPDNMS